MKLSIRRRRRLRAKRRKVIKEAARLLCWESREVAGGALELILSPNRWSPELARAMRLADYYSKEIYGA